MHKAYYTVPCTARSRRNNWRVSRWAEKFDWLLEGKRNVCSCYPDWKVTNPFVRDVRSTKLVHKVVIQKVLNFYQSRDSCIFWRGLPRMGRMHIEWWRTALNRTSYLNWSEISELERQKVLNVMQWTIFKNFLAWSRPSKWKSDVVRDKWGIWWSTETHWEKSSDFLDIHWRESCSVLLRKLEIYVWKLIYFKAKFIMVTFWRLVYLLLDRQRIDQRGGLICFLKTYVSLFQ